MPERSILELDEAKRRLESIERDHAQFVELISKLKEIRGSLLELKANGTKWLDDGKAWVVETQGKAAKTIEEVGNAGKDAKAFLEKATRAAQSVEDRLRTAKTQMEEWQAKFSNSLQAQAKEWEVGQARHYEEFRQRHFASLDEVTKSYERMRVSYDAVKVRVESWDAVLEELRRTVGESRSQTYSQISQVERVLSSHIKSTEEALERLSKESAAQAESISKRLSELGQHVDSVIDEKLKAKEQRLRDDLAQERARIDQLARSSGRHRWAIILLWVVVVAGFLGIASRVFGLDRLLQLH